MTNQRCTQCPHCKASFKVSEDQIKAANGRVRCGSCMNIFDAIAYTISELKQANTTTPEEEDSPSSDSPPVELEEAILGPVVEDDLFEDNPEEDSDDTRYSGSQLSDELSTSFLDLDESPDNPNDPYSTSFKEMEAESLGEDSTKQSVDESWTQDILEENAQTDNNIEPIYTDERATEERNTDTTTPENNTFTPIVEDPSDFLSDASPSTTAADFNSLKYNYQLDEAPKSRKGLITLTFSTLNIVLLSLLLAQAGWFHYEKLAKYPTINHIFQLACEKLKCTLPKLEAISKIKSQNLIVRSHPTTAKALIIDTVIVNDAHFNQAFPDIALYFSDINKQVIAQRLISSNEYLSGELLSWENMPNHQPIHVSLEIIDPGKEAVNYSIRFFIAKTTD